MKVHDLAAALREVHPDIELRPIVGARGPSLAFGAYLDLVEGDRVIGYIDLRDASVHVAAADGETPWKTG